MKPWEASLSLLFLVLISGFGDYSLSWEQESGRVPRKAGGMEVAKSQAVSSSTPFRQPQQQKKRVKNVNSLIFLHMETPSLQQWWNQRCEGLTLHSSWIEAVLGWSCRLWLQKKWQKSA